MRNVLIAMTMVIFGCFLSLDVFAFDVVITVDCYAGRGEFSFDGTRTKQEFINEIDKLGYLTDNIHFCTATSSLKVNINQAFRTLDPMDRMQELFITTAIIKVSPKVLDEFTKNVYFLKKVRSNDWTEVEKMLKEVSDVNAITDYLSSCKSVDDNKKIALYYACRSGNLDIIYKIKEKIGDDNFAKLVNTTTENGRTILIAAAQSVNYNNREKIINLISSFTKPELLKARESETNCTAYDFAILRGFTDDATLRALKVTKGTYKTSSEDLPLCVSDECTLKYCDSNK